MFWLILQSLSIITAVILCCIGVLAAYIHKIRCVYKHIPGPEIDSFWYGHRPLLVREFKKGKFFEQILYDLTLKYGCTFKIFIFHVPLVFTADKESVKDLLIMGGHPKSPRVYKRASKVLGARCLGNGLVTILDQDMWSKKRRIMNPAFRRNCLTGLISEFNAVANKFVEQLTKIADGKTEIKLLPIIRRTTLDAIAKIGFGNEIDSLTDDNSTFFDAVNLIMEGFIKQTHDPFMQLVT